MTFCFSSHATSCWSSYINILDSSVIVNIILLYLVWVSQQQNIFLSCYKLALLFELYIICTRRIYWYHPHATPENSSEALTLTEHSPPPLQEIPISSMGRESETAVYQGHCNRLVTHQWKFQWSLNTSLNSWPDRTLPPNKFQSLPWAEYRYFLKLQYIKDIAISCLHTSLLSLCTSRHWHY